MSLFQGGPVPRLGLTNIMQERSDSEGLSQLQDGMDRVGLAQVS